LTGLTRLSDIHQVTGFLKTSFAQTGIIGKTDPWQMASAIGQSGDACALRAGNVDFTFIRA
jgi:hypothetical protein